MKSPCTLRAQMQVVTPGTVSPKELQNALLKTFWMTGVKDVSEISLSPRERWDTSAYGTIVLYDVQRK